jgi:histidine ammonia-lyase
MLALYDYFNIMKNIEVCGALCYEALRGTTKALDPRIHDAKHHKEEIASAANLRKLLAGSEISEKYRDAKVQDCYIMRAMPQIHGAARKLVLEAYEVIMDEMHGCSDNPELFIDGDEGVALMCGNFDGTYVGSHADMLTMSAAIIGNIVERSTDRMVNRNLNDGLPAFLAPNPGLNNGFMIPQYTSAALESEIKILAQPSTIDSISTCANQEDPVSMAYFASKKAGLAVKKLEYMVSIEYIVSLQAVDFLKPLKQSPALSKVHDYVRKTVPFIENDQYLHPYIEAVKDLVASGELVSVAESVTGELEF